MNTNYFKKLIFFCFGLLISGIAISQVKNVISIQRVFPKIDKVAEFEKAIAAHAKKYHSGEVAWRVFSIESGPDFGGYQLTEGPTSWEALDNRGDLGDAHMADWNKNIAIYLTDKTTNSYVVYEESLSSVGLSDLSDKIQVTHVYPKIGKTGKVKAILKNLKAVWSAEGSSVAVYSANASGPSQYAVVTRFKQGLKEKASGFRKPFKETYEGIFGEGALDTYSDDINRCVQEAWSELLFLRKDLSSQ